MFNCRETNWKTAHFGGLRKNGGYVQLPGDAVMETLKHHGAFFDLEELLVARIAKMGMTEEGTTYISIWTWTSICHGW
jgi:hypothetical protein